MESLRLSFEAVMPIFILMLIGYLLRCLKVTGKKGFETVNTLVFKLFLPVLLFYNIYQTNTDQILNVKFVLFLILGVLFVYFVGYFSVFAMTKDNARRGVLLQSFFRSNRNVDKKILLS